MSIGGQLQNAQPGNLSPSTSVRTRLLVLQRQCRNRRRHWIAARFERNLEKKDGAGTRRLEDDFSSDLHQETIDGTHSREILRSRHEGRHHQRYRLPERRSGACAGLPVQEYRRHVGRSDRSCGLCGGCSRRPAEADEGGDRSTGGARRFRRPCKGIGESRLARVHQGPPPACGRRRPGIPLARHTRRQHRRSSQRRCASWKRRSHRPRRNAAAARGTRGSCLCCRGGKQA